VQPYAACSRSETTACRPTETTVAHISTFAIDFALPDPRPIPKLESFQLGCIIVVRLIGDRQVLDASDESVSRAAPYRELSPVFSGQFNSYVITELLTHIGATSRIRPVRTQWYCLLACLSRHAYPARRSSIGHGEPFGHGHRFAASDAPGCVNRLRTVQNVSVVTAGCLCPQICLR
jgi:hypothetical protein